MKTAIISGATGFIGSKLACFLISKKVKVIALGRKDFEELNEQKAKLLNGAEYIKIDMQNIDKLPKILKNRNLNTLEKCVFYNLAWWGKTKLSDTDVENQLKNIFHSVSALKISNEIGCKKFIHVGTMEEAFTEKYLSLDYRSNNEYNRHVVYALAKITSKRFLKISSSNLKMPLIFATNSHVMGCGDDKDSFLQVTLQKLINNEELLFSKGNQVFDCVALDDLTNAYYLIGQKGKHGSDYWIGSGEPRELKKYVKEMYNLFPSSQKMQFGKFLYNDISLKVEDFSISRLVEDTGFKTQKTFKQMVIELHDYLK